MPEGDIVLRVARRLDLALAGQRLARGELRWGDLGDVDLAGSTVLTNLPVGKHLLTRLDDGRTLHTHLRMDGSWWITRAGEERGADRSHRVRAVLGTDRWTCMGRSLGMVDLVRTRDERLVVGHLGPDLLADGVDLEECGRRVRAQGDRPIGAVLLDQTVVAGIGTLYLAESLWAHRIHPLRPAHEVSEPVCVTARELMLRSADAPLPTATGETAPGRTSHVHGRGRLPCRRCGTPIAELQVGPPDKLRPAFFCPRCQPA
ncbi:DNA-formamidopyrimidine glycosylase family protein [Georgenia sp. H159]|uniref:DNA-formamidopyrimidine glycosylase family protein n=1 Tax=Georgenia sp. H159 TaxID=3076115 RepID=UPI002D78F2FB|nr:DNA-formamidopyrimidine glycosylase family protein [Georgenia sp. H159]